MKQDHDLQRPSPDLEVCLPNAKPSRAPSMGISVGGLINESLDLEHHCRDKGREQEKAQNGRKGAFLDPRVQSDQRDRQQSRNAEGDGSKDIDGVCWLICLLGSSEPYALLSLASSPSPVPRRSSHDPM